MGDKKRCKMRRTLHYKENKTHNNNHIQHKYSLRDENEKNAKGLYLKDIIVQQKQLRLQRREVLK